MPGAYFGQGHPQVLALRRGRCRSRCRTASTATTTAASAANCPTASAFPHVIVVEQIDVHEGGFSPLPQFVGQKVGNFLRRRRIVLHVAPQYRQLGFLGNVRRKSGILAVAVAVAVTVAVAVALIIPQQDGPELVVLRHGNRLQRAIDQMPQLRGMNKDIGCSRCCCCCCCCCFCQVCCFQVYIFIFIFLFFLQEYCCCCCCCCFCYWCPRPRLAPPRRCNIRARAAGSRES
mmetsp:Transcript_176/g.347  ORF Transcript_176/g.347 Transcript_176/m.347 type:complete len:232 (+) Transcript_176:2446-3141(+)